MLLPSFLRTSLEADFLVQLLTLCRDALLPRAAGATAARILASVASVPRFATVAMFLDDKACIFLSLSSNPLSVFASISSEHYRHLCLFVFM